MASRCQVSRPSPQGLEGTLAAPQQHWEAGRGRPRQPSKLAASSSALRGQTQCRPSCCRPSPVLSMPHILFGSPGLQGAHGGLYFSGLHPSDPMPSVCPWSGKGCWGLAAATSLGSQERALWAAFSSLLFLTLLCTQERRSDMAHHPTFRKIYCDAVPYLFKKARPPPRLLPPSPGTAPWLPQARVPQLFPGTMLFHGHVMSQDCPHSWAPPDSSLSLPPRSEPSTLKAAGLRRG